ncbi:MAG: hypothetical protein MUO25_10405, partial [Thermoanaerobaculaceae bacterium]|nr:hypothetical protein [Thermoanaerobaculaceae bacterium]
VALPVDRLRWPFVVLHLTLGVVVFVASARSALAALHPGFSGGTNWHIVLLGTVEALGAVLFLLPKCTRVGGAVMLATFAIAIVAHAVQREFPGNLLVYAASTWFVMAHDNVWRLAPSHQAEAA